MDDECEEKESNGTSAGNHRLYVTVVHIKGKTSNNYHMELKKTIVDELMENYNKLSVQTYDELRLHHIGSEMTLILAKK